MKKKLLWFAGFFVLLLTAFYFFLFWGTNYYKANLPVLAYVPDFSFTGQDSNTIDQHSVDGKVYVTEYFFTTCKGICPRMNENMRLIFDHFKNDSDFAIVSHTSMPETDSVPLM